MDVILLKKVAGLGALGDKVSVRSGYGRNYLLPGGFAVSATADNLKAFEERRAELEREAAEALAAAESRKAKLDSLRVTIGRKAGEEGRLFGSVGTADIAEAVSEAAKIEVLRSEVRLPDGPLRAVGEFSVNLRLHADLDCDVVIEVVAAD
ncbi:50S ribosomal protein L9 [Thiorhodovibrio frisius]|uniref:Large ribosomal subunit protein bL9 n=1 Tax=Thiorhodovibrio frisius TaxID=631362 RepID=H8Z7Z1_9GAMM|nr:50S ribosomal protein L9 [Thiorhodovibrio frisius]EIC21003.1 ribosomal protein L9 [Thiorhodovibrio frisius]WPL22059.1 50S ribosomal protein L9 [Thiorhodovibrio frisius]